MADKKQKQQPLSLNERHNRVLQGLSASHARPHSKPHPSPQGDKQSKVKLDLSDDFPRFSGITDFDCRSPVEMKTSKFEVKGSSKALVNEQEGGRENRIAIYDPQPNLSIIANGEKNPWRIKIDGKASSEDLLDGEEYVEEKQPMKIKMQGRRRLCKVSSNDDNHDCDDGKKGNANDDSAFSGLADFDSPPALRYAVERGTGGGDEIRDILNDLSSRLEILSIEKKCAPEMVDLTEESLALVKDEDYNQTKKEKFPEYTSAAASFSLTSDLSDCSSDAANQSMVGGVIETGVDADEENESEVNNFVGGVSRSKNVGRQKKNETKSVRGRSVPMWQTFAAKVEGQDEQDEDCVILSGKKIVKEVESTDSSFSSDPSNPSLDASNQSVVGGGIETWVNKYQEESDQENESLFDNSIGRLSAGNGQKKNKTKRVSGKSVPMRQTFAAKFEGQDEEDDDCVVWSEKKKVKEVVRQCGNFQKRFDDSDKVDVLDDCSDDSNENSITLRGPKSTYMLPSKIAKMLYPHQRDGMKWLWSLHCQRKGGILGDDMGLGKTIQICGFLAGLFHSCLIKRALIVAPKTLLPHWIKELSTVGLSEKTREYFGSCAKTRQYELQYILQDKGILLTTYDIVRNNAKSLRGDSYFHDEISEDNITWDYMILDEGHLIKNPGTQRAKSLLEIPSGHRIVISGTPIQNNLKELWALFNFCCPELLGDKNWFKEKYEYPILRGNDKNASDREKRIGSTAAKELRERIQPCFLRRLKNEVFHEDDTTNATKLSKKNEIIVWLKLTSCQRQMYEAFLKSELVLSAFDGSPLAAITILKKICDHPLLLTKRAAEDVLEGMDSMLKQEDNDVAEKLAMHIADVTERSDIEENHEVSCKISFIISLLDNLISEGHYVLIFSQTRKMLNLIQESLVGKGYKFLRIDGTTKAGDRVKIVDDFQEGTGGPIFLLTSQVGGLGLTLTRADRVIVVDPAWNPSTDNQSVDRAYRIGQNKDVLVYRLMTCGTIEEKIYRKQIFKGGLFKTATEHKEQTRYFSQEDLRELFSLPKQGFDVSLTQQQLHEEHDRQHTMSESLKGHMKFLETQGIAGVSHHSLLFSKTTPVPVIQEEEEIQRVKGTTFMGNSSSTSRHECDVDGAKYAFNPKDVKLHKNNSPASTAGRPTEIEIKERINRLSQILANKVIVSKLPDKGHKIHTQVAELKVELEMIQMAKRTEKEAIHLDDIAGEFQRVLNV